MNKSYPHMYSRLRNSPPIRFPIEQTGERATEESHENCQPPEEISQDIMSALESMNRSIKDLARELNCLGFFDEDDDDPKAA